MSGMLECSDTDLFSLLFRFFNLFNVPVLCVSLGLIMLKLL